MIIRPLIEGGWLDGVIAMMERRGPALMVAGDIGDEWKPTRVKVAAMYAEQKRAGRVNRRAIAAAVGLSLSTVHYHLRHVNCGRKSIPRKGRKV